MSGIKKLIAHPYLLLLIAVLAVAVSSILIKASSSPTSVAGMYRLFLTVLIMLPIVPWKMIRTIHLSAREWTIIVSAGFFLGLHFLLWMESLRYTSVASSMVILALQPIFVMIGAYFLFKERITSGITLCMAIAVVGSIVIAWGDIGISKEALWGDILSLLGTIAVAAYMLAGQKVSGRIPANLYSVLVFFVGGITMFLYNVVTQIPLTGYPSSEWMYFLLLAIVPTIFGQLIFNQLLKRIGATTISMGIIGEPVIAILLAYIILHETIGFSQLFGGLLTITGMGMYFYLKYLPLKAKVN